MKWILNWVTCWFGVAQVNRSVAAMQRKIDRLKSLKEASDRELVKREKEFSRLHKWMEAETERNRLAIAQATEVNRKMEIALDNAQDAIKTLEDITIPGLVAANNLFIQRWEAETSVFVARQVAVSSSGKDLE